MTNDQGVAAAKPDFGRIEDKSLWELIAGARRLRLFARLAGLALVVAGAALGGRLWLTGGLLGWLLVEINLDLLIRTLVRAPFWRGRSLRPTLLGFYLLFGATVLACFILVRGHASFGLHPLAFLLGLLTFFAGLVLGILSWVIKKPEPPSTDGVSAASNYVGAPAVPPETDDRGRQDS